MGPPATGDSIPCVLGHHLATWALGRADPQERRLLSPVEAVQAQSRCPRDLTPREARCRAVLGTIWRLGHSAEPGTLKSAQIHRQLAARPFNWPNHHHRLALYGTWSRPRCGLGPGYSEDDHDSSPAAPGCSTRLPRPRLQRVRTPLACANWRMAFAMGSVPSTQAARRGDFSRGPKPAVMSPPRASRPEVGES